MTDRPADQPASDLHGPQRDIDFASFFASVWRMRVPLALALVAVSVAYWGYVGLFQVRDGDTLAATYSRTLHFVFEGAEQGRYPNGAPFQIADVVAPDLLEDLFAAYGLAERGVLAESFADGFNIQPHVPEYQEITARYASLREEALAAADRDRTGLATALSLLREQFEAELLAAGRSSAMLSFRPLPGAEALRGGDEIDKLLLDLPQRWARRAIDEYKVLQPDAPVPQAAAFYDAAFATLDYLPALDRLRQRVDGLHSSVHALLQVRHAKSVRDDELDIGLRDVQSTVEDIGTFQVQPLAAHVAKLGIAKAPDSLIRQYEHRVAELGRAARRRSVGCDALQQVLAVRPAFAEELLTCRRRVANLEAEASAKRFALAALVDHRDELRQDQEEAVQQRLSAVLAALREQADLATRLQAKLAAANSGRSAELYRQEGGLEATAPPPQRSPTFIYVLLLFGTATAVLVIGSLQWPGERRAQRTET